MNKHTRLSVVTIGLVLIANSVVACAKPAPPPAQFEVVSLDIMPSETTPGETATITAKVKNIGGSEGVYAAVLTVDGVEAERRNITVAPGMSQTITFALTKDKAGRYQVAIDGLNLSLTVKQRLVAKEMELKYDDGTAEEAPKGRTKFGHLIDFVSPAERFTIKKIRVLGVVLGNGYENRTFAVQIWDKDRKVLFNKAYEVSKFPAGSIGPQLLKQLKQLSWVELEVPDIGVSDKFYLYIWTDDVVFKGLHIGADNSVKNEHSTAVIPVGGSYEEAEPWPLICPNPTHWWHDKSKVNWMIRVVGTVMVPGE